MISSARNLILILAMGFMFPRHGFAQVPPPLPFLKGVDVSSIPQYEATGIVFRNGQKPKPILEIFRDHGANAVRLRLFVHPNGRGEAVNDLPYTIRLAQEARKLHFLILLDLHYSDTWADPGHQVIPAAWKNLTLPDLVDQVRTYTVQTVKAFADAGATPDLVQVGNEINNGLLHPLGGFDDPSVPADTAFDRIAALLGAGIDGVRQAAPQARIVIHAANGERTERVRHFFDELAHRHVAFDIVGLSYYPTRGTLSQIAVTLNSVAAAYRKPVLIVETACPWRSSPGRTSEPSLAWPPTPEGQKQYLLDLTKTLHDVPNGLGAGFFYWHPDAVRAGSLPFWQRGDMALFDSSDNALPALDAFEN